MTIGGANFDSICSFILVALFNHQGLAGLEPCHAGWPAIVYDAGAKTVS